MKILQQFWREIIIVLLAVLFLFSVQTCKRNKNDKEAIQQAHDSTFNLLKVYRNKNNELVTEVKTHAYTIQQINDDNGLLGIENDKLKKQVGALSNLVGFWKGKAQVVDTFTVINHDTTIVEKGVNQFAKYFKYDNKYLFAEGIITDKETVLNYDYHFDFKLTPYRKRDGLFKKKQLVTDITFSDPNLKVKEFTGIVIQEPKKKWYETQVVALVIGLLAGRIY